ncbi:MAG: DUF459 domain-containing protein [Acidimicrobiales bacterium]
MSAGRAVLTVLSALLLAALLAAPSVERAAEHQSYGAGRDLLLDVARPLASLSHALRLDRPRDWLASATGHADPPAGTTFAGGVSAPSSSASTSTPSASSTAASTTTTAVVTTTTQPPRRVPTFVAPLKVWMGGDSLMGTISDQVQNAVSGDGRYNFTTDAQVGTGLVRSDVLDWAAELSAQMQAHDPDVVVLSFGGNDDQPLHGPDGAFYPLFTPEWQAEYAHRVGIMMDIASKGGARTVVWLGLPSERPENLDGAKEAMNAAAQSEAAKRLATVYTPLGPLLAGPGGGYTDDLTAPDGSTVRVRRPDGVHLTEEGAALVTPSILDAFAKEWHLR